MLRWTERYQLNADGDLTLFEWDRANAGHPESLKPGYTIPAGIWAPAESSRFQRTAQGQERPNTGSMIPREGLRVKKFRQVLNS